MYSQFEDNLANLALLAQSQCQAVDILYAKPIGLAQNQKVRTGPLPAFFKENKTAAKPQANR